MVNVLKAVCLLSDDKDRARDYWSNMENRGISVILFDLDNTLVDTAGAGKVAIHKVSELLKNKLDHSNISDICERFVCKLFEETFDPSEDQTIDKVRINHWHEALQEVEVVDPGQGLASDCYYTWKTTRLQALALSPEVLALLEDLRCSYKLLLLTNGDSQTQREKIEALRCEGLFSAVVVGGEHAEQKPASSIFTHCFELLGVNPQDCIMVGDSLDTDIQGGFNAGVRATVWINKRGGSPPENTVTPDYTIPSVLDLPEVLDNLR
ncbi:N-acylneuraminate-9-phosphatase [Colossoma macropomum]|uniref:N-acylneuraminate-9-phosphatase n=1 Tax=Colossoma macropomum TaxID=42526 RepID=UPI001864723F|nr:N-acylneuraminate-9-phosphatase [Colossoma macropomum]